MPATITVSELQATPNDCPLDDPLQINMMFESDQPVKQAHWEVQYIIDMTGKRHILQLGSTDKQDYPAGKSSMRFAVSAIEISGLKRGWLNNVGLLLIVLKGEQGENIIQVSMVTQIELQGSRFIRHMLSPLD